MFINSKAQTTAKDQNLIFELEKFLKNNENYSLLKEEKIMPSEGFDGFYMALIERKA